MSFDVIGIGIGILIGWTLRARHDHRLLSALAPLARDIIKDGSTVINHTSDRKI